MSITGEMSGMQIRLATIQDRDRVRDVHRTAFQESEGETVADLAGRLLAETTSPETISLVAETEDLVVGHVAFSPVTTGGGAGLAGYILAPLGVKPGYQKRGVGTQLIEAGMRRLSAHGVRLLFVYGDPEYYCRFGFRADTAERYIPPYTLQYPFGWQARVLEEGVTAPAVPVLVECAPALCDPSLW